MTVLEFPNHIHILSPRIIGTKWLAMPRHQWELSNIVRRTWVATHRSSGSSIRDGPAGLSRTAATSPRTGNIEWRSWKPNSGLSVSGEAAGTNGVLDGEGVFESSQTNEASVEPLENARESEERTRQQDFGAGSAWSQNQPVRRGYNRQNATSPTDLRAALDFIAPTPSKCHRQAEHATHNAIQEAIYGDPNTAGCAGQDADQDRGDTSGETSNVAPGQGQSMTLTMPATLPAKISSKTILPEIREVALAVFQDPSSDETLRWPQSIEPHTLPAGDGEKHNSKSLEPPGDFQTVQSILTSKHADFKTGSGRMYDIRIVAEEVPLKLAPEVQERLSVDEASRKQMSIDRTNPLVPVLPRPVKASLQVVEAQVTAFERLSKDVGEQASSLEKVWLSLPPSVLSRLWKTSEDSFCHEQLSLRIDLHHARSELRHRRRIKSNSECWAFEAEIRDWLTPFRNHAHSLARDIRPYEQKGWLETKHPLIFWRLNLIRVRAHEINQLIKRPDTGLRSLMELARLSSKDNPLYEWERWRVMHQLREWLRGIDSFANRELPQIKRIDRFKRIFTDGTKIVQGMRACSTLVYDLEETVFLRARQDAMSGKLLEKKALIKMHFSNRLRQLRKANIREALAQRRSKDGRFSSPKGTRGIQPVVTSRSQGRLRTRPRISGHDESQSSGQKFEATKLRGGMEEQDELEEQIRVMFRRMREVDAQNPELLARVWQQESEEHFRRLTPNFDRGHIGPTSSSHKSWRKTSDQGDHSAKTPFRAGETAGNSTPTTRRRVLGKDLATAATLRRTIVRRVNAHFRGCRYLNLRTSQNDPLTPSATFMAPIPAGMQLSPTAQLRTPHSCGSFSADDVVPGQDCFDGDSLTSKSDHSSSVSHVPLDFPNSDMKYQIPSETWRQIRTSRSPNPPLFSHELYRGPDEMPPTTVYCRTFHDAEQTSKLFLSSKLLGLDLEWKSRLPRGYKATAKESVSMVQIASEDRIALFHIALFTQKNASGLIPPTLKRILESPDIIKVGVNIKGDCTRLRTHFGIHSNGILELSHLYKAIRSAESTGKISKGPVRLADQVEEHIGLPLDKPDVRTSDWSKGLNAEQKHYAAADAYCAVHLYDIMNRKRLAMSPVPLLPPLLHTGSQEQQSTSRKTIDPFLESHEVESWLRDYLDGRGPGYKAKAQHQALRVYVLWHVKKLEIDDIQKGQISTSISTSSLAYFLLDAIRLEDLPFDPLRARMVLGIIPTLAMARYKSVLQKVEAFEAGQNMVEERSSCFERGVHSGNSNNGF